MQKILAPSILSADFKILGEQLRQTAEAGAQYIHFDVMDGDFVPSISFGMPVLSSIRGAHRAGDGRASDGDRANPVCQSIQGGGSRFSVRFIYEACEDLHRTLEEIHKYGMKAGDHRSKPNTPVYMLHPFLKEAEMFLIMSVEPGFGGQSFIPYS